MKIPLIFHYEIKSRLSSLTNHSIVADQMIPQASIKSTILSQMMQSVTKTNGDLEEEGLVLGGVGPCNYDRHDVVFGGDVLRLLLMD